MAGSSGYLHPHQWPLGNDGIGFGGNYASAYCVVDDRAIGTFDPPSCTVLFACFTILGKFRFVVNVDNLPNTENYIGYIKCARK